MSVLLPCHQAVTFWEAVLVSEALMVAKASPGPAEMQTHHLHPTEDSRGGVVLLEFTAPPQERPLTGDVQTEVSRDLSILTSCTL